MNGNLLSVDIATCKVKACRFLANVSAFMRIMYFLFETRWTLESVSAQVGAFDLSVVCPHYIGSVWQVLGSSKAAVREQSLLKMPWWPAPGWQSQ